MAQTQGCAAERDRRRRVGGVRRERLCGRQARRHSAPKATLYLYFDTKKEIFRAVAQSAVASLLEALESQVEVADAPFAKLAPQLLLRAAGMMKGGRVPAIARMVIGESRNFPDLACIWHDDVVASVTGIVTGMVARAQARGEVAPGDPRLYAFSLMGPMVMAMLFREVFGGVDANPPDLNALADQHAGTALRGLLTPATGAPMDGGRNEAE
jgi:AcrR family transcriptional regulator